MANEALYIFTRFKRPLTGALTLGPLWFSSGLGWARVAECEWWLMGTSSEVSYGLSFFAHLGGALTVDRGWLSAAGFEFFSALG